jgi:cupin 2 domain-containing protein
MTIEVENIFRDLPELSSQEEVSTLFQNSCGKIARIVSQAYSGSPGFWYDQDDDEWVMVVRGEATLEFEGGELVRMKEGDHVTIPRHVKHRVAETDAQTIWLAVHVRGEK